MSLKEVIIKKEYRSLLDNVAKEFYIPLLQKAVLYKRAVGFFSSSVLIEISKGILGLVKNAGKIQLIASPYLSDEDVEAIKNGYSRREIVRKAALRELKEPRNAFQEERLNFLANLIADGILDVKIAITDTGNKIGMYHEKVGIIEDSEGNKVAFSGSMNESANALLANYETIDVYTSWSDDKDRVESKEKAFDLIWNNNESNIKTIEFEDIGEDFIKRYKRNTIDYKEYSINENDCDDIEEWKFFKVPDEVDFYDYQKDAIDAWIKNSCCGIYDMATGSGKTYTALGSITKLSQMLNEEIAVVIVAPYQHLVEQWVEDINNFNVNPIVAYSYRGQKWRQYFIDAVNAYNIGARKNFCIITTNATFASDDFQNILNKFKKNFCFIVDEAHNFGATKLSSLLPKKARYRLALSATIERHRDEEGTVCLRKYFGKTCISFSLKDAINKGFLTSYYYHPIIVYLSPEELEDYNEITKKIIKMGGITKENLEKNKNLELLLIKRARIVAGCKSKVDKLLDVIKPFKDDSYILVYCGATKYDNEDISDDEDIRQIDEVSNRLYGDLGMKVRKFTSSESKEERIEIKRMFATGRELQVITAIKCLDEGVNIPAIKTAFILASSTNPKEYIQRRGRVLRKFEGKEYAEIFDFITLPRPLSRVRFCSPDEKSYDLSLVRKEFTRMIDFADTARNKFEIDNIKSEIERAYTNLTGGYFDE